MSIEDHHRGDLATPLGFAVLTVTDSRLPEEDRSGPLARNLAAAAGHRIENTRLLPNEPLAIQEELRDLLAREEVDAVVLTGGTGVSPRDITVEAVRPLLERQLEGFGELFRALSYGEIGAAAMLSRATAGVAHGKAVFVLPGSPPAIQLAMEKLILPEIRHLLGQARKRA
jgi:molybdenum cofactor biosynthesis protein B